MKVGIGTKRCPSRKVMIDMAKITKLNGMTSLRATVVENGQTLLVIPLSPGRKIGRYKPFTLVTIIGSDNKLHIRHQLPSNPVRINKSVLNSVIIPNIYESVNNSIIAIGLLHNFRNGLW